MTSGLWKHGEKHPALEIKAEGTMDLRNLFALFQTPLLPEEVRSKTEGFEALSGISRISFKGKTIPGTSFFSYEGEFFPREASLMQKGNPVPLVLQEGEISFSNSGMGFSKTKIESGRSFLTVDGLIREESVSLSTWGSVDLKQLFSLMKSPLFPDQVRSQVEGIRELTGTAEVRLEWQGRNEGWITALKGGEIRLRTVDLKHRDLPVPLSQFEGSVSVTPGQIRFDELKGGVGDSPVAISGTFSQKSPPAPVSLQRGGKDSGLLEGERRLSFQISSPQLDLDPLFPKKEDPSPTSFGKLREWLSNWSVEGKVDIQKGKYRNLHFQDLKAEMRTVEGTLVIRPFQCQADGGDVWGEGWIKPAEKGVRFEIKPRLSNLEAKAFFRTLFQNGEDPRTVMTGSVHVDRVTLQGEGDDFEKVKASLNGSLRFEVDKGMIERWKILSRIFSILNVSQLFMGRLPDLKTKGFPFHQVKANFDIKDGIASTEDFFVDSDSMKITIFGKVDLGKSLIDARIGVHPLVTIDTLLGNVPIAGYILTGEDKGFISYFYQVKGNLDDPRIEAIPLKSIEETSWGVIRRLLETPLRPFQKSPSSNSNGKNRKGSGVQIPEPKP
jgi:hypothetical protein